MKHALGSAALVFALVCAAIFMVPQVLQGAPLVGNDYRPPPALPPGYVNLFANLTPGAAIKPGPLNVEGCRVVDVQLGNGWMKRSSTATEPYVLQDHSQKLSIECTTAIEGMAGHVDQDPHGSEALTTWRFAGGTPSQWTPDNVPDVWQTLNFSGASGIEILFNGDNGDSGGMLVYVYAPQVTPTPTPTVTPTGTLTVTPTETPTETPTGTPTGTLTVTPTGTPTGTLTVTPTGTPIVTSTPAATATLMPTLTPTPPPTSLDPVWEPNLLHRVFLPVASR